jgi:dTDP-4-dehydrorhamnose reductase
VFDGSVAGDPATAPALAEDAPTAPRSAYGRSKLAGEQAVLSDGPRESYVVRTAWLYGEHGRNFVRTMLDLEAERPQVEVVTDQWGQPTWTRDLAARLVALGDGDAEPGIYHVVSGGRTTWNGLARAVFAAAGADPDRVRPTTSAAFVRPAPRPAFSVLGGDRLVRAGVEPMPQWEAALTEAMSVLTAARAR